MCFLNKTNSGRHEGGEEEEGVESDQIAGENWSSHFFSGHSVPSPLVAIPYSAVLYSADLMKQNAFKHTGEIWPKHYQKQQPLYIEYIYYPLPTDRPPSSSSLYRKSYMDISALVQVKLAK